MYYLPSSTTFPHLRYIGSPMESSHTAWTSLPLKNSVRSVVRIGSHPEVCGVDATWIVWLRYAIMQSLLSIGKRSIVNFPRNPMGVQRLRALSTTILAYCSVALFILIAYPDPTSLGLLNHVPKAIMQGSGEAFPVALLGAILNRSTHHVAQWPKEHGAAGQAGGWEFNGSVGLRSPLKAVAIPIAVFLDAGLTAKTADAGILFVGHRNSSKVPVFWATLCERVAFVHSITGVA